MGRIGSWIAAFSRGWGKDFLAVVLLLASAIAFFLPNLLRGSTMVGGDIRLYYYPVMEYVAGELKEGRFPLWTPYLFGGFPLYADGNSGALYPINLLALSLFSAADAFNWLAVLRFFQAAAFMYFYVRVLQVGVFGAIVAALTFAFSGFAIGHLDHVALMNSAVWLPLVFAGLELAYRTSGMGRIWWLVMAAVAHGMQWLGLHPQPPMMSLVAIGAYIVFRPLLAPMAPWRAGDPPGNPGPPRGPRESETALALGLDIRAAVSSWWSTLSHLVVVVFSRGTLVILALALTIGLALGIAAVQILPLLELGNFSGRARVPYEYAATYSLPPFNLITLFLPYFFYYDYGRVDWALWHSWELALYAGVLPLMLAGAALFVSFGRWTLFFAAAAAVSLVVAMGSYSPLNLHQLLYQLPGFQSLRAPGRFTYLFDFSIAVLAGIGAHGLQRVFAATIESKKRLPQAMARLLFALAILAVAVAVGFVILAGIAVQSFPAETKDILYRFYLTKFSFGDVPSIDQAYSHLKHSLSLDNASIIFQIMMAFWSVLCLVVWSRFRRWSPLWQTIIVLTIVVDLFAYGRNFYPSTALEEISDAAPAAEFVKANNGDYRVYSWLRARTEPNLLLPLGIMSAGGYDQLEIQRHAEFVQHIEFADTKLIDLLNIRYMAARERDLRVANYRGVIFNPKRPLLVISDQNLTGRTAFSVPNLPVSQVWIAAHLEGARYVADQTPVAEVILTDLAGRKHTVTLRAGADVADWAYERSDGFSPPAHGKPEVAYSWDETDQQGQKFKGYIYFSQQVLDDLGGGSTAIKRVQFRYLPNIGKLAIFGVGLADPLTGTLFGVGRFDQERYKRVYRDARTRIVENRTYLPRVLLAPRASIEKPGTALLYAMTDSGSFDPRREVRLEEYFDLSLLDSSDGLLDPVGTVAITRYDPTRVTVEATGDRNAFLLLMDSYYPGWKALVDGQETKIYRADYIFRAVYLPAGQHTVEFIFDPPIFRAGLSVTLATISLLVFLGAVSIVLRLASRR